MSKKAEKSTYFGQKVAGRGSDDKKKIINFLHEKLHLGKKTEGKFIFQARARKYFIQFSEAKNSFRKNRRKTGKPGPEQKTDVRKRCSAKSYPGAKKCLLTQHCYFFCMGGQTTRGGVPPPACKGRFCTVPLNFLKFFGFFGF